MKFKRSGFIKPTKKFELEHSDYPDIDALFNIDMIYFTKCYEDAKVNSVFDKLYEAYNGHGKHYEYEYSLDEIYSLFKDYSDEDYNNLGKYVVSLYDIKK